MRKALLIVLVAALALVGCSDDGEETAVENSPASGAQTSTTLGGGVIYMDHGPGAGPQGCPEASATLRVQASNTKFSTDCLAGKADEPLTLTFENKDQIGHNIVFLESHSATEVMFRADIFRGPSTQTFTIPAQKPGKYAFHCEVHPTVMKGTFEIK